MYTYRALDRSGNIREGEVKGDSEAEAMLHLKQMELAPLSLTLIRQSALSKKGVQRKDILTFTTQAASMLGAKLPVVNVLSALADQAAKEGMRSLARSLAERVSQGAVLSDALAEHPEHFSRLYVSVVRAGEAGGLLAQAFTQLSQMMEKDEKIKRRLKGALTYPVVMLCVMVVSVAILMTFVVPKFAGVFSDMGGALPLPTRVLIELSNAVKHFWWLGAMAVAGGVAVWQKYRRTEAGRLATDRLLLRIPLFGTVTREVTLARFSLTVGVLLKSGVPLLDAMTSAAPVAQNAVYENALQQTISSICAGEPLGDSLARHKELFPALFTGMISTGEKAGNLDEMFASVGQFYETESDTRMQTMTTLLEPLVILVMGVVVGAIIVAMLMPIFEMSNMVK